MGVATVSTKRQLRLEKAGCKRHAESLIAFMATPRKHAKPRRSKAQRREEANRPPYRPLVAIKRGILYDRAWLGAAVALGLTFSHLAPVNRAV
jgi:hypothetical protein